ncbi:MAG: ATP-grasp domain-containing protein [Burkholderiaceae bacterium]|nr:ATP-grasp domain-containing protein [Burkholderiaceae bacterium]
MVLAVAALSARALVESAARDGLRCVALDVFGDADTRRAAAHWLPIGEPAALRIDGDRLLRALRTLAAEHDVTGWIAGSGFEAEPELLEAGGSCLPLLGTAGSDVRRVRDPVAFFHFLRSHGIAHPPVAFAPPRTPGPWLHKDSGGCGGWHVRRSADEPPGRGGYWQIERAGAPMSATFVANGHDAVVLGFNRQLVRAVGARPFVFAGVIGPLAVDDALQRSIGEAVRRLAREFRVFGLASLDFVLHGDAAEVIELNPRPPASLALYPRVGGHGALHAHRHACARGVLPPPPAAAREVHGLQIVFAPRALQLDPAGSAAIARWPGAHDLPAAGTTFMPGDPLCSVSASGADAAQVQAALAQAHDGLLRSLEALA